MVTPRIIIQEKEEEQIGHHSLIQGVYIPRKIPDVKLAAVVIPLTAAVLF